MPSDDYRAICGWLDDPDPASGVRLAGDDGGWTRRGYPELAADVRTVAALLAAAGLRAGDGVCVVLPTEMRCIAAMFAVWSCGATVTMVAPPVFGAGGEYGEQLRAQFTRAAPRLVVTTGQLRGPIGAAMADTGVAGTPVTLPEDAAGGGAFAASAPENPAEDGAATASLPGTAVESAAAAGPARGRGSTDRALVQFTSGSSGAPKGVPISWRNLAANVAHITGSIGWRPGDATVSWLPLYHDMGLVGAVIATIAGQGELFLIRPDQFIREPLRWVRAMAEAQHAVAPSFGLGYTARRVRPEDLVGLDLSGLRSLITGAEPVDVEHVSAFTALLAPAGYDPAALRPAYGLAECTLMATITRSGETPVAVRIDSAATRFGAPVAVVAETPYRGQPLPGGGWLVGLGGQGAAVAVRIAGTDGAALAPGTLGEVVLSGASVAAGYHGEQDSAAGTRFTGGELWTGDAGFLRGGRLYVLGRMGSSLKVRGRSVFMEDLDARIARETGLPKHTFAAVAMPDAGAGQGVVLFAEHAPGDWTDAARKALRAELGPAHDCVVVTGERGLIRRTSSGKPRRRLMWELYRDNGTGTVETDDAPVFAERRASLSRLGDAELTRLLEQALAAVEVPAAATVLLEGSIAEGFGNEGSDIDFLAVSPGAAATPVMPSVLFLGGRRVEVRTRSEGELRAQLDLVRKAALDEDVTGAALLDLDQELLNRCQRFARAAVVRPGAADIARLRQALPLPELSRVLVRWWSARATQSLRQAVAMAALRDHGTAAAWAADGLLQAVKGYLAERGETYLESKWLGPQLDRLGADTLAGRYFEQLRSLRIRTAPEPVPALASEPAPAAALEPAPALAPEPALAPAGVLAPALALAAELGVAVADDPAQVVLTRVDTVTTWPIDGRIHVVRGRSDVLVLSDRAARAWRGVVFGRSVAEVLARGPEPLHAELAEFVRLGLVGLRWGRGAAIRPAVAMVKPLGPSTLAPCPVSPVLGIGGGTRAEGQPVTLSPLPATRFTECASALVWSNVIVENAREDLVGALGQGQPRVAEAAADRLLKGAVRLLLCTLGISPLPPDVAPVATLERLVPAALPGRDRLLARVDAAARVGFAGPDAAPPNAGLAVLDDLVDTVRAGADLAFPASFDSHEQWRATLRITYDWLRLAAYLDTELPIDEVQDLLASGGAQPHQRGTDPNGELDR
ncbi:DUF6001 family protein [Nocardia sp. NPDC050697]|uniref:DUF6001 family protein n=1 Tax=Nocardia sp. NPDC050697 TaxID=3155158 RepID=UPI0034040DA1